MSQSTWTTTEGALEEMTLPTDELRLMSSGIATLQR